MFDLHSWYGGAPKIYIAWAAMRISVLLSPPAWVSQPHTAQAKVTLFLVPRRARFNPDFTQTTSMFDLHSWYGGAPKIYFAWAAMRVSVLLSPPAWVSQPHTAQAKVTLFWVPRRARFNPAYEQRWE